MMQLRRIHTEHKENILINYIEKLQSNNAISSTPFKRSASFIFAECSGDVGKVTESDFIGKVDVWTVCSGDQVGQVIHSDVEKILIDGVAGGLFEAHLYAPA